MSKIRAIAFVLPQFHPIPENDEWWGKGFTEWTNVAKAKPLFKGHYQPHLPTDLGYYDLRLAEARKAQAELAKAYGIYGFCYYHYWFNGKRLLNQPVDGILELGEPDMPFMLCWANENWTRRWDGKDDEILIKQKYSNEDDIAHIRWLCTHVFNDERYIKVNGCPIFMIYRQDLFPDIKKTAEIWREIAEKEFGYKGLYLCVAESFNRNVNPSQIDFDALVEFSPHAVIKYRLSNRRGIFNKLGLKKKEALDLRDFKRGVMDCINRAVPSYKFYRSVTPNWDNTPRKGSQGIVGVGSSPELYEQWLKHIVKEFVPFSEEENFVFINALNEWAEGNHLEPCIKYGLSYFEATANAFK